MPKGVHFSRELKEIMFRLFVDDERTPEEVLRVCFTGDTRRASLGYLERLQQFFLSPTTSSDELTAYIYGALEHRSRPCVLDEYDDKLIAAIQDDFPFARLWEVREAFIQARGIEDFNPCLQTIANALVRTKRGRKKPTFDPPLACPIRAIAFLAEMERIDTADLMDFDGTSMGPDKFKPRMGRCDLGKELHLGDWWFVGAGGSRAMLSAMALYSPRGFLAWRIFTTSVNHDKIEYFLMNDVAPVLRTQTTLLCDNASVHSTPSTIACLNRITNGYYKFVPPYEFRFKPIERGFANIWNDVRNNYKFAMRDPVGAMHAAFVRYSSWGPDGHKGKCRYHKQVLCLHLNF